jgi:hypothetical protein
MMRGGLSSAPEPMLIALASLALVKRHRLR